MALELHFAGDPEGAEQILDSILERNPQDAECLHVLGLLKHRKGEDGISLVRASIAAHPERAPWRNDLGNMLCEIGDAESAAAAFLDAIELDPGNPLYWNNLGACLEALGKPAEAEQSFRQSIAICPEFRDALSNLGNLLDARGREIEASEFHCRAYVLPPHDGKPKEMLGIAYYRLGRIADAASVYRSWMEEEPENPVPRHLHASCADAAPSRASDEYIEKAFDDLSGKFDDQLAGLSYNAPSLIGELLAGMLAPDRKYEILDAGCGTGLCASRLKPHASTLVGVDLSSGMLELAEKRGCYDVLIKAELASHLFTQQERYDLVVAADTLIYFGDLSVVSSNAKRALRPGGCFVFTLEESDNPFGWMIQPSGRYAHGSEYVRSVLRSAGFASVSIQSRIMRHEFGNPLPFLLVAAS
ncbi:MAG: tetratricopeptide repeat protein [Burkholderiales bacterium]|nr:tetratricopeptide repeat protein [Burkholderiales bacterium]